MALKDLLSRLRLRDDVRLLDPVLAAAAPQAPLVERMEWLADLFSWIRGPTLAGGKPLVRLKFLLGRLDRHEAERERVAKTLASLVGEVRAVDLLASAGVPSRFDFLGELTERLRRLALPTPLVADDFAEVVPVLFSSDEDAEWIRAIDADLFDKIAAVLGEDVCARLRHDAEAAVKVLAALIEGEAADMEIRRRLEESPDDALLGTVLAATPEKAPEAVAALRARVDKAIADLDEEGASIDLTYRLDRLASRLERLRMLLPVVTKAGPLDVGNMLSTVVREGLEVNRFRGLFGRGTHLLARKVVDHAAEVGRHYIAASRGEYWHLFRAALGGGAIMGLCTILKALIGALKLPTAYEGLLAGVNYATGFVVIQALGFTVATKQPASTAPAIAAALSDKDAHRSFAPEVARLIRSQIAAIVGNLVTVVPTALVLDLAFTKLVGHHAMTVEKAAKTTSSLSFLGPTPLYAAWTGILLFVTALLSGVLANWLAFHRVRRALGTNRVARRVLGAERAAKLAERFVALVPGTFGNVFLGMALGVLPAAAMVLQLPYDIRHVTVGSGSVALAAFAAPPTLQTLGPVLLAAAGALTTGLLNVAVSFTLAMLVALRANTVHAPWDELVSALVQHLVFKTREFFLPPK